MSKAVLNITQAWQTVAVGAAIFTIKVKGAGAIFFNETEDDASAYVAAALPGEQFSQNDAILTKCRATGSGWVIIADGVL